MITLGVRDHSAWARDFVDDACGNGQQIECVAEIDEFARERLRGVAQEPAGHFEGRAAPPVSGPLSSNVGPYASRN